MDGAAELAAFQHAVHLAGAVTPLLVALLSPLLLQPTMAQVGSKHSRRRELFHDCLFPPRLVFEALLCLAWVCRQTGLEAALEGHEHMQLKDASARNRHDP